MSSKTIKVMSRSFRVKFVPPEELDKLCERRGYVSLGDKVICIVPDDPIEDFGTFLHEAIHVYEYINGRTFKHEEIDPLVGFLTHLLFENKLLNEGHWLFGAGD